MSFTFHKDRHCAGCGKQIAPQPEASARGRANIDILVLLKCSRCGKEFNPADGCVDIFTKPKSDGSLGFEFSVKAHKESTDSPLATLCLDCIENWLQDSGVEKCEAKRIAEQYRPKKIEVNYAMV